MKQNESNIQLSSNDEMLIYQSQDGTIKVDVLFQDETVWLTQEHMAMLFGKGRTTITEHIRNIFEEGELHETMVCRNFRHTTQHSTVDAVIHKFGISEFSTKPTNYYKYRQVS